MLCKVLTTSKSPGIGAGLTYESGPLPIIQGSHVRVPLRNKTVEGVVIELLNEKKEKYSIKEVSELLGNAPLLTAHQLETLQWMADHYYCSLRQAIRVWLPRPPWNSLLPQPITGYRFIGTEIPLRGKKQQLAVSYLEHRDWTPLEHIKHATGVSTATLKSLCIKGVLAEETRLDTRTTLFQSFQRPSLTLAQNLVYDAVQKDARPSLIFGITGSGKTEIYASLIADVLAQEKQAILLVPEILLTEQMIQRFGQFFYPDSIAVLHSRLSPASRREQWRRIHHGSAQLVIGSRSALFAPVQNLGLIIIDEEHEWTYKNEQTPRYHARETAEKLCSVSGAKFVLGTATPSLESWSRAKSGRYHLAELAERYGQQALPDVRIIDLGETAFGKYYPFSPALISAIDDRLSKGEQSVLFLNRRGAATSLLCMDCRKRIVSPESNLPFTVHFNAQKHPYLIDHTTGSTISVPEKCPSCKGSNLRSVGAGTQGVEHILEDLYPDARVLRADADTLQHPEHMRLLLKKMEENAADILLGTQSVVKGLDLPNVTLAAVLLADVGLSLPHFRAGERVFQLLTQLTGRSGRAKHGQVIIQTFRPQATEIAHAARHETREYLEQELRLRVFGNYPPASEMIRLIIRTEHPQKKATDLCIVLQMLNEKHNLQLKIGTAPTLFSGGRVWHVLIRGENPKAALKGVDLADVVVDADPMDCV